MAGEQTGIEERAPRFAYQPALDGLRAFAVAAVLVYHQGNILKGGFLGVDVFFVLSGFLITSLLVLEHRRQGHLSLRTFWARRARRLLPAFFLFMLLVIAYAVFAAPSSEFGELRAQGLASLAYVQNWYVAHPGREIDGALSHVWSLSIEEQWYLVWPFLLAGLLALFGRRWRVLTVIVAVLGLASAVWMAVANGFWAHPRLYFGTDTRAQELLGGAALALVMSRRAGPARSRTARTVIEIAGLAGAGVLAVLMATARTADDFLFEGGFLLVALAAIAVIVAAMQPGSPVVRRVLSWKPFVAMGLISYGVYLFHMPVYRFLSTERLGMGGYALLALRAAVTVAIATVSFRLLERPIRRGVHSARLVAVTAPAIAGVLALVLVAATAGATKPPSEQVRLVADARRDAPDGAQRVLVIGGSNAAVLQQQSRGPYDGDGIRGLSFGAFGCGVIQGLPVVGGQPVTRTRRCAQRDEAWVDLVRAYQPAVVVILADGDEFLARQVGPRRLAAASAELATFVQSELDRLRRELASAGARHVVLLTAPCTVAMTPGLDWVTSQWRAYGATHRVLVGDLAAYRCPDGRVVESRTTGPATWKWLAPLARHAADTR